MSVQKISGRLTRDCRLPPLVPLTDAEVRLRTGRDEAAVVDLAIEGMESTAEEAAMFAMFLEERLPDPIRDRLIAEWIAETLPAGQHRI